MDDIRINKEDCQFELKEVLRGEACITYRLENGVLELLGTYVSKGLEGKGIGSALAKYALEYARQNHLKVQIMCPFVLSYVKRHPEYNDILV